MKILHLAAGQIPDGGGATKGAYWLHEAQRKIGIDSTILINGSNNSDDNSVMSMRNTNFDKFKTSFIDKIGNLPVFLYPKRKKFHFDTGFTGINFLNLIKYKQADIIHLHWINGLVSIKIINKINKPVVWTMRDMWPITGGCHYPMDCNNYKTGCGYCPQLQSNNNFDLSKIILNYKKKFLKKNIKLVGVSEWISNEARKSYLFKDFDIRTIKNNINTNQFFPINKIVARQKLKIVTKKKVILTGAIRPEDYYKGFHKLSEILKKLDKNKYFLCFFGNININLVENFGLEFKNFGYIKDSDLLRNIYSSADVFIAPNIQDASPKTVKEANACGTPIACFDTTGLKDIVEHKVTGFKSKNFNSIELVSGIEWICNLKKVEYELLCFNSRQRMKKYFDSKVIAHKYKLLYNEILNKNN
jgi:glycosyltransferase involved in cell wall biosynthesis